MTTHFNYKLDRALAISRLLAVLILIAFSLASSARAQDPIKGYIGGGVELGQVTGTTANNGSASTVAGGFMTGKYSFTRNLEFQGKMRISDQSRFSFDPNTTIEIDPQMLFAAPLSKSVEILAGGGVLGQMITGGSADSFNPDLVVGLRISGKYQFTGGLVFNEMTGNALDSRYRAIFGNARIIHPLNDRLAFYLDATAARQNLNPAAATNGPRSQFSVGVGFVVK